MQDTSQPDRDVRILWAEAACREGRVEKGEALCREVLGEHPHDGPATLMLAAIMARTGRIPLALDLLREVLARNSNDFDAAIRLGVLLRSVQRFEEALSAFQKASAIDPKNAAALNELGLTYALLHRFETAISIFEQAVSIEPDLAPVHENLAKLQLRLGRLREAEESYRKASSLAPEEAEYHKGLGLVALHLNRPQEAVVLIRRALRLRPDALEDQVLLGQALIETGKLAEAESQLRKVLSIDANNGAARGALGSLLKQLGRFEEARHELTAATRLQPKRGGNYQELVNCFKVGLADGSLLEKMKSLLQDNGLPLEDQLQLRYALGKSLDDLGEYKEAMVQFEEANRLAKTANEAQGKPFDLERFNALVGRIMADSPKERFQPCKEGPKRPIFIVGLIRSGTTLVEQILSRHPEVCGGGEISFWTEQAQEMTSGQENELNRMLPTLESEYLRVLDSVCPGASRVTDKMPGNFIALGLIHLVFPNAKIIWCNRDPRDNGLSIFTTPFRTGHTWVHDKETIAQFYRQYQRLMDHWQSVLPRDRFLEVEYEALVSRTEEVSANLLKFCDLDWSEACLKPEENSRPVKTPSQWQVRQPVYASSIGRWRNYEPWLGPIQKLRKHGKADG